MVTSILACITLKQINRVTRFTNWTFSYLNTGHIFNRNHMFPIDKIEYCNCQMVLHLRCTLHNLLLCLLSSCWLSVFQTYFWCAMLCVSILLFRCYFRRFKGFLTVEWVHSIKIISAGSANVEGSTCRAVLRLHIKNQSFYDKFRLLIIAG